VVGGLYGFGAVLVGFVQVGGLAKEGALVELEVVAEA